MTNESEQPEIDDEPSVHRNPAADRAATQAGGGQTGTEESEAEVVATGSEPTDPRECLPIIDEIKATAEKLLRDGADRGECKLLARAIRELRYSFKLLKKYRARPKVTVFGSARTPRDSQLYRHAVAFGAAIAEAGFTVITGGGPGLMEAAHEGAGRENSIGFNILLPFEQEANPVIQGTERVIHFKYFFTRKLLFLKEASALVLLPGGFGTFDEGFEVLTLIQTGKSPLMPVVLLDIPGGHFWERWLAFVTECLFDGGMISPEDFSLFRVTTSVDDAVDEITTFYRVYHSQRYVRGKLALRLNKPIDDDLFARIQAEFTDILAPGGAFVRGPAHTDEANDVSAANLPRLFIGFNRRSHGRLRQLVDMINREV